MRTYLLRDESAALQGAPPVSRPAFDKRARWPWVLGVIAAGTAALALVYVASLLGRTSGPAESLAPIDLAPREQTTATLSLLRTADMSTPNATPSVVHPAGRSLPSDNLVGIGPRVETQRPSAANAAAVAHGRAPSYGAGAGPAEATSNVPAMLRRLGLPEIPFIGADQNGLAVRGVTEGSLLHRIGLRDKDVLMTVNGQLLAAETVSLWLPAIMAGQQLPAYVLRDGQTIAVHLSLPRDPALKDGAANPGASKP